MPSPRPETSSITRSRRWGTSFLLSLVFTASTVWSAVSDREIADRARTALLYHPRLSGYALTVTAEKGTLLLDGVVTSQAEKALAEEVVRKVEGVAAVRNRLEVTTVSPPSGRSEEGEGRRSVPKRGGGRTDEDFRLQIEDGLRAVGLEGREIEVSVQDGVATLTGTVDSWDEYNAAVESVRAVEPPGLVNKLLVRPFTPVPRERIGEELP